jgi:2'-5' RNA ligase
VTVSALIVPIPDADRIVGEHRRHLDPSASWDAPAHVTILVPFVPPEQLDADVTAALEDIFATTPCFEVTFARTETFSGGTLWLAPEPVTPFVELTAALVARWPEHPPYGGAYRAVVPHLTVAHEAPTAVVDAVRRDVERRLPLRTSAKEAWLLSGENAPPGWEVRQRFPLG